MTNESSPDKHTPEPRLESRGDATPQGSRWEEALTAVRDVGYDDCITIESFHPDLSVAPLVAVWRHSAETPEALASEGLAFVRRMHGEIWGR